MKALIDKLEREHILSHAEFIALLEHRDAELSAYLFAKAEAVRQRHYGTDVYVRGLIEFTNYCKNDCLYCGIRRSNRCAQRYRLTEAEILACCQQGYDLGYRTFVLQGGEDPLYSAERIRDLVLAIKARWPDCAVTLSFGEHSRTTYRMWREAGADRYLLRHETANDDHYRMLHPAQMDPANRKRCLWDLKDLGYQVGCGFMVGSPGQTPATLAKDMVFMQEFRPQMVGVGPFLPHKDTPFRGEKPGSVELTLFVLALCRLMLPGVLLPATTALGTAEADGRVRGVLAGCNVIMPNLSPASVRKKYMLYDNKAGSDLTAEEGIALLRQQMEAIGYEVVIGRGDYQEETL